MLRSFLLFTALGMVFFNSCSDDEISSIDINEPVYYEFLRDGQSTVSFDGQTTRISMATELVGGLRDFSNSSERLLELYSNETSAGTDANPYSDSDLNASTKSVKSKVAASKDFFSSNTSESMQIKAEIESWIKLQVSEVAPNTGEMASPGKAGQIADGSSARYVNAKGLEYNQAVSKSLIGALMVDQICNHYLSTEILDESDNRIMNDDERTVESKAYTIMEHKWDEAYGYLFGASTDASDPLSNLGNDNFLNKYLLRVNDDSDFNGIATDIFNAFKLGRAAIVAGDYELRDEQAEIIREKIAVVLAARSVYYLQQGKLSLASSDLGDAFHDLSEGFGFVYSLRFLRKAYSNEAYFSRAEVDGFINQLTAENGFWDITANTLDQISESIANKFDFTIAQAAQ